MNTAFLLMAQYGGRAVIPLEKVREDYFPHLKPEVFRRKLAHGEISLAVVRMEKSQKAAQGIHTQDLAAYIDARRAEAERELKQMVG